MGTAKKVTQEIKANVRVYEDKGSLALRFSTKYNNIFTQLTGFSGRQKCMGLKMQDTPTNRKQAQAIALQIERDLEHPDWDKLFDPTFAKYGIGDAKFARQIADIIQLPNQQPQMTVGELWDDYLLWKKGQVQPNTFEVEFCRLYTNLIKGLKWGNKTRVFTDTGLGIYNLPIDAMIGEKAVKCVEISESEKKQKGVLAALREAYDRAVNLGKIPPNKNPFKFDKTPTTVTSDYADKQDSEGVWREWWYFENESDDEELKDTRHYTLEERDVIIKAFYESDKPAERHAATLIEFKFLTGCRCGEAFALRWKDVSFEHGYIRFSKSFRKSTGNTQQTKTATIRMFKLYPNLEELLKRIQANSDKTGKNDLVFTLMNGNSYGSKDLSKRWYGDERKWTTKAGEEMTRFYPGLVNRLVEQGLISTYLVPYSTRHTFITLQAQNGVELPLLAANCGTSVDVIYRHYLGFSKQAQFINL
jgi:integrase